MIMRREPHPVSYEHTLGQLREVAQLLDRITDRFAGAFFSNNYGYDSYYGGNPIRDDKVYHFSGVPCYEVGEEVMGHKVLCVTPRGTCFHIMGQCPERKGYYDE